MYGLLCGVVGLEVAWLGKTLISKNFVNLRKNITTEVGIYLPVYRDL